MRNYIDEMLDLIKQFGDRELINELHEAINNRYPANVDHNFDSGMNNLCDLFVELL